MKASKAWKRVGIIAAVLIVGVLLWSLAKGVIYKPKFSSSAKTRHLVVISVDALASFDFDQMRQLPHFKEIMDNGSYAREAVGVYPSLTYPSHTSIITGVYPDKHGIYTNEVATPGVKEQPWHWYKSEIKVPTLYDIAKKSNMTVGALFWPVMAGAKVDYNLPEIWTMKEGESQLLLTLKSGRSPLFLFNINSKFGSLRDGTKQPQLDNFTAASAAYMIKTKKPNLALIHLTDLDHQRHKHGTNSQEAKDALKRQDERIGQIIQAAKDAGIYDDTTFVVLGDHAFKDVDYKICLNTEFRKQGLIDVDSKGNVTDWKVYANYCDGSVQIKLKNPDDSSVKSKVEDILNKLKNDPSSGIEAVYNQAQAKDKGVSGDFQYMAEARDGYYFSNDWLGDLIVKIDKNNIIEDDEYSYQATHGFDPSKPNYQTFFMACGSGVKKGVVIPSINIVDEGPTMAALLGLNMPDTDGRVLNEIIK